jgi:hypothetical protein
MFTAKEVHVPAPASTKPIWMTEEFPQEHNWFNAAHDQWRRPPVVEGHCITFLQLRADPRSYGFLANPEVHFTRDLPLIPYLDNGFFKQAAFQH